MANEVLTLLEGNIIDKDGKAATIGSQKKYIGLYFSAHWCPPCRGFTPELVKYYKGKEEDDFEIVFVSSDRNKDEFESYFKDMGWLALNYDEREIKDKLCQKFQISGIPTLVILEADGTLVTKEGRQGVMASPKDFPWYSGQQKKE